MFSFCISITIYGKCFVLKNDILCIITETKVFLMNQGMRDISTFKKLGFAVLTTGAQVPIYIAISAFLGYRFCEVLCTYEDIRMFANYLIVLLGVELVFLAMMGRDAIKVRKEVVEKAKRLFDNNEN
mgnify:CR=1 FL=1